MKTIISVLLLSLTCLFTNAQFKQIAEGPKFAEPEEGFAKIIQMKNGNTFFISISLKNGINVRIYDAAHKETAATSFNPAYQVLKTADVEAIFEMNSDIIVFISERDDHTPVLYRLIIDAATGKLKEEKTIFRMKKEGAFVNTGAFNSFSVVKDPFSENYAVCLYYVTEPDPQKRIEIVHYGKDHNEISRTFCATPNDEYKFFLYVDMVVTGSEKVCAILFASNEKYYLGTKKGNLYMAAIEKGKAAVSYSKLDFSEDLEIRWGLARYSAVNKDIFLLTAAKVKKEKDKYIPYLVVIEATTGKVKRAGNTEIGEKLNTDYKEKFDRKKDYSGMPQNLFINDDGSFAVVYEEILVQRQSSQSGFGSSTQLRVDTKLGKIVVAAYDKNAALLSSYLVPKEHWIIFQELSPFYHARREGTAQQLFKGNQYKSFAYLNGINKNYILFNDTERNNDVKKDKFVEVQGVSDCDAFVYKLSGNEIFPKREYAFENTTGSKNHNLLLYAISDYDRKNNVYVTLRLDKEVRTSKEVKLVWLQPQ
ncbi:MAG: hypothetical protein WBP16_01455 [Ferruginibacter sp.]